MFIHELNVYTYTPISIKKTNENFMARLYMKIMFKFLLFNYHTVRLHTYLIILFIQD